MLSSPMFVAMPWTQARHVGEASSGPLLRAAVVPAGLVNHQAKKDSCPGSGHRTQMAADGGCLGDNYWTMLLDVQPWSPHLPRPASAPGSWHYAGALDVLWLFILFLFCPHA